MATTVVKKEEKGQGLSKIGSFLRNTFFNEVEVKVPVQPPAPAAASPASVPIVPTQDLVSPKSGIVDDALRAQLLNLIEEGNIDGYDFKEFNDLLDGDGTVRTVDKYTNAYNTIKRLSKKDPAIKKTLLESGQHYIKVLTDEQTDFEVSFQTLVDERVGTKRKDYEAISKEVAELDAQRTELERKIKEKQTAMAGLEDEISKHNIELDRQRLNFLATMGSIIKDFQEKVDNIELHLPADPVTEPAAIH
jgi:hypothetical protein